MGVAERFVLQSDMRRYESEKSLNDRERFTGITYMLSLLAEDIPFTCINAVFCLRIALNVNPAYICADGAGLVESRPTCEAGAPGPVQLLLLFGVLLFSALVLMYKIMKVKNLVHVWHTHKVLLETRDKLKRRSDLILQGPSSPAED